jgi:hypothetical protein
MHQGGAMRKLLILLMASFIPLLLSAQNAEEIMQAGIDKSLDVFIARQNLADSRLGSNLLDGLSLQGSANFPDGNQGISGNGSFSSSIDLFPWLSTNASVNIFSSHEGFSTSYNAGITLRPLELFVLGGIQTRIYELELQRQIASAAISALESWKDVLLSEILLRQNQLSRERSDLLLRQAQVRYEQGSISRNALREAQEAFRNTERQLSQAQYDLDAAALIFSHQTGFKNPPLLTESTLQSTWPRKDELSIETHPSMLEMHLNLIEAERSFGESRWIIPGISLNASTTEMNSYSLTASISLSFADADPDRFTQAEKELEQLAMEAELLEASLNLSLEQLYARLEQSFEDIPYYEDYAAELNLELTDAPKLSELERIELELELAEAEYDALNARFEVLISLRKLELQNY